MTDSTRLERAASIGLAAAAIVMAAAVGYREIVPRNTATGSQAAQSPSMVQDWKALSTSGRSDGSSESPIQFIEFTDLECPACRQFQRDAITKVRKKYGERMNFTFVHLPLGMHKFAKHAAAAAECAAAQNRFDPFVDAVFGKQDSLGLKPWSEYATDAGVSDLRAFEACRTVDAAPTLVAEGQRVATKLNVHATPTIIINGWRLSSVPSEDELIRVIDALLAQRNPFPSTAVK